MKSRSGAQPDLGGFDPRFFGLTLRFSSPEQWRRFGASSHARTVSELTTMPADERFVSLAEMTVLQHELRHFHDFLLSPYGHYIFRLKLQAFFNGFQAFVLLLRAGRQQSANCLPIPLARWCRMPKEERRAQIAQWDRGPKKPKSGGGWRPPEIPSLPNDVGGHVKSGVVHSDEEKALHSVLTATVRAYDRIGELLRNPDGAKAPFPLQPWHVMEVSALLVQMQEIENQLGATEAHRFFNGLHKIGFPESCVRLLYLLAQPWRDRNLDLDLAKMAEVVSWALMGDYEIDGWKACPTVRISQLSTLLKKSGLPQSGAPLRQLFNEWSKSTGLSEPFEGIRRQLDSNKRVVDQYAAAMASSKELGLKSHALSALDAAKTLLKATSKMQGVFVEDPEGYVHPDKYLKNLEKFPRPLLRCEFDGVYLKVPKFSLKFRRNWVNVFARKDSKGQQFMRTGVLRRGVPGTEVVKPTSGINLYLDMVANDYAFQPHNRLDWEFGEVVREALSADLGLVPLHITG